MQHILGTVAVITLLGAATLSTPAIAAIPLPTTPSWQSTPNGYVSTGGEFGDVDGDGWLDMVVANGNDMARQRLVVYRNNGDGTFPLLPTWSSADIDYHGHLDLGDVNGDGRIDCVVGVYLGAGGFGTKGMAKLYLNDGSGGFTANPAWMPGETFYCFSVALGDVDGDGDLDLACACGDDYNDQTEQQRIFLNDGGTFEPIASWKSDDFAYALDVHFGDVDRDGDLEPLFCGSSAPVRIYRNDQTEGGGISTAVTWQNTDLPEFGNTASFGDWNGDGFPEVAVADNNQLGGGGRFKVYANTAGIVATAPAWLSSNGGYGSNVSWADLDLDGDLDLTGGRWWGAARIYENTGGALTSAPIWQSATNSVIENLFWGDVDRDGLRQDGVSWLSGTGTRTCFFLGQAPIAAVSEVRVDGTTIPTSSYALSLENGWVSIFPPPPAGAGNVEVHFAYSVDLDLGVTNWDSTIGNYLFRNSRGAAPVEDPVLDLAFGLRVWPNPVRSQTSLRLTHGPASPGEVSVMILDASGRRIRQLYRGRAEGGLTLWEWDRRDDAGRRVPAGTYYARVAAGQDAQAATLVVLP